MPLLKGKMKGKKSRKQERTQYPVVDSKLFAPISWTKHLLTTHPIEFISTVGRINRELVADVAPFATCLDTSYDPPYVTFAVSLRQHSTLREEQRNSKMNTYLNIKQNGLFVVNVPGSHLIPCLDHISRPCYRENLKYKVKESSLTMISPYFLLEKHQVCPPLIKECLAHLECKTVDIHRPRKSDHYLITGGVLGISYDESLGRDLHDIKTNLVNRVFHHFGTTPETPSIRHIATLEPDCYRTNVLFKAEK